MSQNYDIFTHINLYLFIYKHQNIKEATISIQVHKNEGLGYISTDPNTRHAINRQLSVVV